MSLPPGQKKIMSLPSAPRRLGRVLNVLCTLNLRPVSTVRLLLIPPEFKNDLTNISYTE